MSEVSPENAEFQFQSVGEKLKAEREKNGLRLADVAGRTRIPIRHLEAIEASDFAALPGNTYTIGFSRSYARAMEMNETEIASAMRAELNDSGNAVYQAPTQNYELADASRVPPRGLAWTAVAIALLILGAFLFWRYMMLPTGNEIDATPSTAVTANDTSGAQTAASTDKVDPNGDVILTASDEVWIKIYDASGKRLYEATMKAGDQYIVPKDANKPMILTGKPNALNVSVGGKSVPALGAPDRTIKDVGVSAADLLARPAPLSSSTASSAAPASAPTAQ